jgi:hypothetical protein
VITLVHRRRVAVIGAVVVLLTAGGVVAWRLLDRPSTYEQAVDLLPRSTLRATFTDWARVRDAAGGTTLGAASSRRDVDAFLRRAYDKGLTSTSAVDDSTYALLHRYGFSPLDAEWEMFGQSRKGQVDVLRLADDVDLAGVERALRTLGYTPPAKGSGTGGTWAGSADLVAGIDGALTPVQQNVVVLPDRHLVLMSDSAAYVSAAADVARDTAPSVTAVAGVSDLAAVAADPVTAVLWPSTFACEDLSMGDADSQDQQVGTQLVTKAGGIHPLSGLVMAQQASRRIVVGMAFETSDQAEADLQPRVDLATGPAPGQGGTFGERFRVVSGTASGRDVVLTLAPRDDGGLLSDLSSGPILFATC